MIYDQEEANYAVPRGLFDIGLGMCIPTICTWGTQAQRDRFNGAWLVCAAIAHNLTRAAGALASTLHARARTATLRRQLIHTPGRLARSAHRLVLHLPHHWPWQDALDELFHQALHDPIPATT